VAVERALREDLEVEIPASNDPNIPNTQERFPFVFHIACDACIASDQSSTAEKNREYEPAALQFDRAFHRVFLQLARVEAEIHGIIDDAEERGLASGELDEVTNERLQKLFRDRDRIHRRILNR
jgi:hypothetical protein